jgi:succinate dehydrogenase / fumarate reductase, flavoprotein subunit
MSSEPMRAETDVLVIGAGGAGMYAAIEAARAGCRVLLIDRSLIGRGGATVMLTHVSPSPSGRSGNV